MAEASLYTPLSLILFKVGVGLSQYGRLSRSWSPPCCTVRWAPVAISRADEAELLDSKTMLTMKCSWGISKEGKASVSQPDDKHKDAANLKAWVCL